MYAHSHTPTAMNNVHYTMASSAAAAALRSRRRSLALLGVSWSASNGMPSRWASLSNLCCATFFNRYVIDDGYGGLAFEEEGKRCAALFADRGTARCALSL